MKESSYKHLTVILAALLTTIVIAIIVLILLLTSATPEQPADSNPPAVSTTAPNPLSSLTLPSTSTTAPTTDGTTPPTTTTVGGNETTAQPPTVTTAPLTDAPPSVNPIGPVSGSAYGDKLGSLELYAEWTTTSYDAVTGSCTLTLSVYCDSYSISIGPRFENYLVINDQRVEFRTEKVSVPTNDFKARTLLYTTEYEVQKDSPNERFDVHVEFGWHYQGSYSGEHAEWLTLTTDFVV